jgi:hypothetical protein
VNYVESLLARNETVVKVTRGHWVNLLPTILTDLAVSLVIVGLAVAGSLVSPPFTYFGLLLLLVPIGHFLVAWLVWRSRQVVVTNRRIIQIAGLLNKRVSDTLLEKINDIVTRQTATGRLLSYGDVEVISGSGLGADLFRRIGDPDGFKKALLEQRGAAPDQAVPNSVGDGDEAVPDLIRELADLREQGLLTDEEFAQKKRELLDRI